MEFYTPENIGNILQIGRTNLYKILKYAEEKEVFTVVRIGKSIRVPKAEFDKWCENGCKGLDLYKK